MYMRVGSKGVARRGLIALLLCGSVACGDRTAAGDLRADLVLDPAAPRVGSTAAVRVTLSDGQSNPMRGARVSIEAHMSHPGMTPVVADARETADGIYVARISFSMAGEWTLVASGVLADGRRISALAERTNVGPPP